MKHFKIFFTTLLCLIYSQLSSQNHELSASFEKDTIVIGEQINLNIKLKVPLNTKAILPEFIDTVSNGIEVILDSKQKHFTENDLNIYTKNTLITSFDTGLNIAANIPLMLIENGDTNLYKANEIKLFVKPFVLIDTIPIDTIFSNRSGFIIFGKNGFENEINQQIPDSLKQSIPTDSLNAIKMYMKEQITQLFSADLTQKTGLLDKDAIIKIIEASNQKMYIIGNEGILEDFTAGGSIDTVFVQEYQQVMQNQALFSVFRIKDISENMLETPFNLAEFWFYTWEFIKNYWWAIIIILILIGSAIYYFKFKKKGKKIILLKEKPSLPAHIIALEKLEKIRNEKIWAKGLTKEFHIQISDVIREYIENRFKIRAVEMTSSEIFNEFDKFGYLTDDRFIKLRQILNLADTVKFAKYQAPQNENDLSMQNSIEFVKMTLIQNDLESKDTENTDNK